METIQKAVFSIEKDEIEEFFWRKLSDEELSEVMFFIENDEGIWDAIEESKKDALDYFCEKNGLINPLVQDNF